MTSPYLHPDMKLEVLMREKEIEQKLRIAVRKHDGFALKLSCPGFAGMPDRLLLFHGGRLGFVEVKRPGQIPRLLQEVRIEMLKELGFKVYVLDDERMIEEVIHEIQGS